MSAIVTKVSRQRRMVDFYNIPETKYLIIGRSSAWADEMNPPTPTGEETTVEEIIGAKLIKNQWYVKLLSSPSDQQKAEGIYYKGNYYYRTIDPADAIANGCTAVMVYAELDRDELPLTTYRQVGLQVGVVSNAITLTTSMFNNLTNKGKLEVIENRKPQTRSEDQMESITILISF